MNQLNKWKFRSSQFLEGLPWKDMKEKPLSLMERKFNFEVSAHLKYLKEIQTLMKFSR